MDQFYSLTKSILLTEQKQVTKQPKEEFFSIKKGSKRFKSSKQFLVQNEPKRLFQSQNIDEYRIIKTIQNLNVKQLHHSLAQTQDPGVILQFKNKALKKKKQLSKIFDQSLNKISSEKSNISLKTPSFIKNINRKQQKQKQELSNFRGFSQQSQQNKLENIKLKKEQHQKQLQIQDFIIIKQIGEGSYSKVYRAIHKSTGFICALKILQKQLIKELNVQQNAIRQIKILMCINHQNISSLYGAFSDQKYIYLVLQICTDGDIISTIKKIKNKSNNQSKQEYQLIVTIIKQIAESIKELHQNNIIHRDIKPQNVLITLGKNVKLSDFGWAVCSQKNILRKTLCGTPLYLAPQFIQTCLYTENVDIWAFGVLCYQLLTNEYPFVIKKVSDLVKIVEDQIDFSKIKDELGRDFIKRALCKKSSQRAKITQLCNHLFLKQFAQLD